MVEQVSFGPFTVDFGTREVVRDGDGQPVHLSPKAYELLCVLIEHRPNAIAKADLHRHLWPDSYVSDATLASLVAELREALGEHGRQARFIRTVHGYGYAFAGEARERRREDSAPATFQNWIVCEGREQPLGDGEHVIGRDADVGITLNSPTVSRRHARLVVAGETVTLEDLGSKNGTYVRGMAVRSPIALADGDRIRIGRFELTFRSLTAAGSTETEVR